MTIEQGYRERTPGSLAAVARAEAVMPGGDTRAIAFHHPYPVMIERGEGAYVWDVDGNRYVDMTQNFSSVVHGHAYPPIVEAVERQVRNGTVFAARSPQQLELAELLVQRIASVDRVRFCNSGTEAAILAMRLARLATGRRKIVMARYGFHGQLHELETGSQGKETADVLLGDHGDAASFERVLAEHGNDVAAVILEPVMGTAGIFAPPPDFLAKVQRLARSAGALFVLDEVIMFRLAAAGAQSLYDVQPDLTTFGKLIGGGFPVGAVGGRAELMALTDPTRNGYRHSGTFNGNLMTMVAGAIAVRDLTQERIDTMGRHATLIARGVERAAAEAGLPISVNHVGSLIQIFLSATRPTAGQTRTDVAAIAKFHLACLTHGLFVSARGFMCTCTAFTDELVDDIVARIGLAMKDTAAEL